MFSADSRHVENYCLNRDYDINIKIVDSPFESRYKRVESRRQDPRQIAFLYTELVTSRSTNQPASQPDERIGFPCVKCITEYGLECLDITRVDRTKEARSVDYKMVIDAA